MTFAKDDPDVLSGDPDVHLSKVLMGHYAYIIDTTTVGVWQAEHCEVLRLMDGVLGMSLLVFYTQRNSSLTAPIDKM